MIQIEKIDFTHWPIKDYIQQVLLISPEKEDVPVQLVHYPQSHELLVLNVGLDQQNPNALLSAANNHHYLCGKNGRGSIYEATLSEPICIVQFKPHAWYVFAKNSVERYANKVLRLKCNVGECLRTFVDDLLPDYLLRYQKIEKAYSGTYRQMPDILDYIEENLNTINVASLGKAFDISEATIRRYFKKYVGMNASHYIRNQKVKRMTLRMYKGDYNAVAVQDCGFYDQSHFIREFKRLHGVTPTQFMDQLTNVFKDDSNAEQLFQACYIEAWQG